MLGFNHRLLPTSPYKSKCASCSKRNKNSASSVGSRKTKQDSNIDSYNETITLDDYHSCQDDMTFPSKVPVTDNTCIDYGWSECATSVSNLNESRINAIPASPMRNDRLWPKGTSWRIRNRPGTFVETINERLETARSIP